ncbi:IS110 family transposase [Paraburkholderia bengalensis]|uniref:IS110 family transposase n=1 Tax=Paraburkholderia bengalensis TaxID=2747562 RepID=UPI0030155FAC
MKYSGIDLHSNNAVVAVTDDEDRVLYCKRLPNDLQTIVATLTPYRDELQGVVVESTFNWYWLVDGLMAAGFEVHLAHTPAIKQYEGLKYAGDERDAVFLAHIFRLGLLPEGYIYPSEERGLRDLARKRLQLVQQRTLQILSIESLLARTGESPHEERASAESGPLRYECPRLVASCRAGVSRESFRHAGTYDRNLRARAHPLSRGETSSPVRGPEDSPWNW